MHPFRKALPRTEKRLRSRITIGRFWNAEPTSLTTEMGSLSECRLLAKNPLKLPDRFQDRGDCPLMAARGWEGEGRLLTDGTKSPPILSIVRLPLYVGIMLLILGTVRLPAENMEAARPVMKRMAEASRVEEGCVEYAYAEDVFDSGLIHVKELWTDQHALDRHFATEHLAD